MSLVYVLSHHGRFQDAWLAKFLNVNNQSLQACSSSFSTPSLAEGGAARITKIDGEGRGGALKGNQNTLRRGVSAW